MELAAWEEASAGCPSSPWCCQAWELRCVAIRLATLALATAFHWPRLRHRPARTSLGAGGSTELLLAPACPCQRKHGSARA